MLNTLLPSSVLSCSYVGIVVCVGLAFFALRRYQRLQHVPGPFLASLTDFWLAYKYWQGISYQELITDLHQKYGPVVRWGPARVSFASPYAIDDIYGTKPVYVKSESYLPMTVVANGKEISTLLTTRDEKRVSQLKRHTTGGFSQASFLRQEEQIEIVLKRFLDLLKDVDEDVVNMGNMLQWWSFDTINQVAFSDDLGYMAAGADIANVFAGVDQRFSHGRAWYALPRLEWLVYKNPIANRFGVAQGILTKVALKRVKDRENDSEKMLDKDLIGRFLDAHRNEPGLVSKQDVIGLTVSTINAGSDTTATTAAMVLMNLLKNPQTLARLEEEIISLKLSTPPPFDAVGNLPYLDACIRESLRITPTAGNSFQREVPIGGATVCGTWLPGKTDVSVSMHQSEFDTEVFGPSSEFFRPERWTEASEEKFRSMDHYSLGFGKGRRVCLGQHLARIEVKKLLASLITLWKISLAEEPKTWWRGNRRHVDLRLRLNRRQWQRRESDACGSWP